MLTPDAGHHTFPVVSIVQTNWIVLLINQVLEAVVGHLEAALKCLMESCIQNIRELNIHAIPGARLGKMRMRRTMSK